MPFIPWPQEGVEPRGVKDELWGTGREAVEGWRTGRTEDGLLRTREERGGRGDGRDVGTDSLWGRCPSTPSLFLWAGFVCDLWADKK